MMIIENFFEVKDYIDGLKYKPIVYIKSDIEIKNGVYKFYYKDLIFTKAKIKKYKKFYIIKKYKVKINKKSKFIYLNL